MMFRALPICVALLAGLLVAWTLTQRMAPRSASEYAAKFGGAVIASPLVVGAERYTCGRYSFVKQSTLLDLASALPGYTIVNTAAMARFPLAVQRYALAHECGHQTVGRSETQADCFAMRRGRTAGWLDAAALDEICAFVSRLPADTLHPEGTARCRMMRACAARTRPGEERT